jgi:acyl-CoA hydrolase
MKHDLSKKIITVEEALKLVKSNDHIFTGLGASEGREFLSKLHTLHGLVKNAPSQTSCRCQNTIFI